MAKLNLHSSYNRESWIYNYLNLVEKKNSLGVRIKVGQNLAKLSLKKQSQISVRLEYRRIKLDI